MKKDRYYQSLDADNKLIWNLRDLGHMLRMMYEGKGSQKRILMILRDTGGMTQRELTERIGVQPGSASEVLGKLEEAGLISRTANQEDRRTTDIRLTPEGESAAKEAQARCDERHRQMFACLTPDEKEELLLLLEKLRREWETYRPNRGELRKGCPEDGHERHCRNRGHDAR